MVRQTAVTMAVVGLVLLGVGAQTARGGAPIKGGCVSCNCAVQIPNDGTNVQPTGCFAPVDLRDPASHCPPCDGKLRLEIFKARLTGFHGLMTAPASRV